MQASQAWAEGLDGEQSGNELRWRASDGRCHQAVWVPAHTVRTSGGVPFAQKGFKGEPAGPLWENNYRSQVRSCQGDDEPHKARTNAGVAGERWIRETTGWDRVAQAPWAE